MKWLIAGFLFALAVGLTIATAAVRADNMRSRREIEAGYRQIRDRIVELRRLDVRQLEAAAPDRLAELHWQWLRREAQRREEQVQ